MQSISQRGPKKLFPRSFRATDWETHSPGKIGPGHWWWQVQLTIQFQVKLCGESLNSVSAYSKFWSPKLLVYSGKSYWNGWLILINVVRPKNNLPFGDDCCTTHRNGDVWDGWWCKTDTSNTEIHVVPLYWLVDYRIAPNGLWHSLVILVSIIPYFFSPLLVINQPGFEHSCQVRVYINWTTVGKWGISISLVVGRALQANCSQSPKILANYLWCGDVVGENREYIYGILWGI